MLKEIRETEFDREVLESDLPVLLDTFAVWCGPCRALVPTLERISTRYEGRLKVLKIDVDKAPSIKREFNLLKIPQMLLFVDGKNVDRLVGAHTEPKIEQMLERYVSETADSADDLQPAQASAGSVGILDMLIQPRGRR